MLYRYRLNGFEGVGLNDLTWGAFSGATDSSYFEVVIDGTGTPDTFKWRENGGAWTTDVNITGASQDLVGANGTQAITFGATTGHTADDGFARGNLYAEACTEADATAQITDSTMRILDPNTPPTFTDTGGKNVIDIDYTTGTATFDGNVTVVTVAGTYIPQCALQRMGELYEWSFSVSVDIASRNRMQKKWKEHIAGMAETDGSAGAYFLAANPFFEGVNQAITANKYFFVELYNYDPDDDQTGDRFNLWATFSNISINAPIGDLVKETVNFKGTGKPSFTANA